MLTGNKGEWSEVYVFLKLLAEGKLHAANANLEAMARIYYPIVSILRTENGNNRIYYAGTNIKVVDAQTGVEIVSLPIADFVKQSQKLFSELKKAEGSSFALPEIEEFLGQLEVKTLKAASSDKSDIQLVVHDLNTGTTPTFGFSIKSMLGKNSTLFNAGDNTNFIYEITGLNPAAIDTINAIDEKPKIAQRIAAIQEAGGQITFLSTKSRKLQLNLQMIDSHLPHILATMLLIKYTSKGAVILAELVKRTTAINPIDFDLGFGHPFYEYKIKNFLTDVALGMTPASTWKGKYDATGGIIIVKQSGELVCYHIYNRNEFQEYLLHNTRFEQASTSRYHFGDLYLDGNRICLNLNLQVRFN